MQFYIIPKYKKAIKRTHKDEQDQQILTHLLTSHGDFENPNFLTAYPLITNAQLYIFFSDYKVLPFVTPASKHLVYSGVSQKHFTPPSQLEHDLATLENLEVVEKEPSYRVKCMLGKRPVLPKVEQHMV